MKTALWIAIALLLGSYICLQVADPDLWWHIAVGKWIIAHREIPHVDYWNMFGVGRPWRAYSWSNEIVFAFVDGQWGARGLLLLQLALATTLSVSLLYVCSRLADDNCIGAIFGGYAAIACYNNFTLRPQAVVWILYAFVLLAANQISRHGVTSRRLGALVLLGCLWANAHITAIIGLGAIVLWTIYDDGRMKVRATACAASAFFVGTLITPYVGGEWLTFFSQRDHPLKFQAISEFQPATILQYSTAFVLILIVLQVVASYTSRRVPELTRCMLAGGMTLAGLTAVKFLPFSSITLCALFAAWWQRRPSAKGSAGGGALMEGLELARKRILALSPVTHGAAAFFLVSICAANVSALLREPLDTHIVPKGALDFIKEKGLEGPILNEFGSGGYVIYRFTRADGTPELLVPIDGRTNVNPPEIWKMFQISLQGGLGWRRYIEAVKPQTILWRQGSAFVSLLFASHEWCRVYSGGSGDNDYVVFIRKEEFANRSDVFTSVNCGEHGKGYGE